MDSLKAEADAMKLIPKVTIRELITNPSLRAPLIIALTIMLAQQLSGINAVSRIIILWVESFKKYNIVFA